MKKIIFIIFGIIFFGSAYATTMCAINDSVTVVLDPTIAGTSYGSNSTTRTWWAQFPYGRISGISACIDTNHGKGQGGTVSKLTDSNGNRVMGNENNGRYCWCKIMHPVSSLWVFENDRGQTTCSWYCMGYCGNVQSNSTLRAGLFGSVVQ